MSQILISLYLVYPGYGYMLSGSPMVTDYGYLLHLVQSDSASAGNMFGEESPDLWVEVVFQTATRLRVRVSDSSSRFEVPLDIPTEGVSEQEALYRVEFTASPTWGLVVSRRDTGELVLDTGLPGLVFSQQFMQLPIRLPQGR